MKKNIACCCLFFLLALNQLFSQSARITCLASDGTRLYAGTERDGVVLLSNNGSDWDPLKFPETIKSSWWEIAHLACNNSTIIAGRYTSNYISTDNGATWKSLPQMGNLTGVAFNGKDAYFSSTGKDSQHGSLYHSGDNGATWSPVNTGFDNVVIDHYAFDGDIIYAGGTAWRGFKSSAVVLVSEDKGTSWKKVTKGLDYDAVTAMVMAGKQLISSTKESYGSKGAVYVLDESRSSFKEVSDYPRTALAFDGNTLFGAIDKSVYFSEDLGKTWNNTGTMFNGSQYEDERKKMVGAVVAANGVVYAAAGYSLYASTDKLKKWDYYAADKKYDDAFEQKEKALKETQLAAKRAAYKLFETDELEAIVQQYNKLAASLQWKAKDEQVAMAKGDFATAYETSGIALKRDKGNAQLMISRAMAALALGKGEEALTLADQLLVKEPANAFALLLRAEALKANEQPQQAIGAYTKVLQSDPTMRIAYRQRAILFQDISRYEDALKDLNEFISADPSSTLAYNTRGMINKRLGNNAEAIADYSQSIKLAPNNYYALSNRGMAYADDKKTALAQADFNEALDFNSEFAEAYFGKTKVYNAQKEFEQALWTIKKAIALNPKMEPYRATHSLVLISLNREKDAIVVADSLLAMNELNSDGWLYKAIAQSNLKEFSAGINTLNAAIAKMPANYLLYSLRAYIYRQQGNNDAAAADDAKAKELGSK